jgi:hypothetical protein
VAVEEEGAAAAVPGETPDDVRASGERIEDVDAHPQLLEPRRDPRLSLALVPGRRIRGREADEGADEVVEPRARLVDELEDAALAAPDRASVRVLAPVRCCRH